ncbi:MAG: hypothetical protein K9J79_11005 [Desulfobacteraceae bacterium]|nr:hypothetical protein [Desulfobacteraceae bacterium]
MSDASKTNTPVFRDRKWLYSYKTSSMGPGGWPVNILHDFYIPVLKRSIAYDRVAGYFRSSSLAVASQGFSALAEASGKMRMIVGADMDQQDVSAILAGDEKHMAARLNQELEGIGAWPEDVKNGVGLLAWMVASGCLEVRVAFRVHGQTGEPLPFESREDGYVHEKWAVFTDAAGDRIYISGSLNESRRALVHNAENINLHTSWWGRSDQQRIEEAAASFETLWKNENPFIRVLTLPEAVTQRLIHIAGNVGHLKEIDGSSARQPEIDPPSALERLGFALIKDGARLPGGRYVGMETAPVKPWPHQEIVARRLIRTWPYNYMLCDEVGLGKTIEAGLAIRSLYLSGLIRRILIAPPASLTRQWHREMASKFFLPFGRAVGGATVRHEYIFPAEETKPASRLYDPDLCIVSTGLLGRRQRAGELREAEPFDLALVDEAHYARRKDPGPGERSAPRFGQLFTAIRDGLSPKAKSLWMATATPMQLNWIEVFDLVYLTRRVGHFQQDPSLTWAFYRTLGKLVHDQQLDSHEWSFLQKSVDSVKSYDPFLWSFFHEAVIDGRIRQPARKWLEQDIIPRGTDRKHIQRLIFAAAPLSRVMLRHTRTLLEIYRDNGRLGANLAKREILQVPRITLTGLEKTAYDELETYCRDLTRQIEAHGRGSAWKTSVGFYLSFLRLRLASSTFSLKETLKRRKDRVAATRKYLQTADDVDADPEVYDTVYGEEEDIDEKVVETFLKNRTPEDLVWEEDRLTKMLEPLADLSGMPLKMKELLSVLQKRRLPEGRLRQTVIFTRFYDTLTDIVRRLQQVHPTMRLGTYSGKGGQYADIAGNRMRGVERDEIKHRFLRGEIDVLVCTDAAAEGINLQTANLIINYDLPWNPMKVEQRIGRIDRIGQAHDRIYVLNLCYVDSAEQIVYDRLLTRLAQAGDVVGAQQISMLPINEDEFAELAAGNLKEDVLFKRARQRIRLQKERAETMEVPADELYEIYLRLQEKQDQHPAPVTLDNIWEALSGSKYLQDAGAERPSRKPLIKIRGLQGVSKQVAITADQQLYEKGDPELDAPLYFASYGESVFDQIVEAFHQFDLPGCVARLEEEVPDIGATVVAFAAACIDAGGQSEIRLITRYSDLSNITLDEKKILGEEDLEVPKKKLHELMRNEFDPTRSIERIVDKNERAGAAHALLNLLVADSLFPDINHTEQDNFWQAVRAMDEIISQRDQLMVPNLPVRYLERIQKDLLFEIYVPQTGDTTSPSLPIILIESAVNTACREADSLREKKSELTIGRVKSRIKRTLEQILRDFA